MCWCLQVSVSACAFLCVLVPCPCVCACACVLVPVHVCLCVRLGSCTCWALGSGAAVRSARLGLVACRLLPGALVAAALWVSRSCRTRVAVTFLSGHPHVIAGPVASLEEAGLRVGPVKVLIKFQVSLVPGQRGSKNRVWRGSGWVVFPVSRQRI